MKRPVEFWRNRFSEQQTHDIDWQPEIVDYVCVNGCIPLSDSKYAEEFYELLCDEAVEFNYDTIWELGDMPILKDDVSYWNWAKTESDAYNELVEAGFCVLPWVVNNWIQSPIKTLYYSQGSRPSCMGHADAFAYHSATLTSIARGMPLQYNPINAIYTWAATKNGSLSGGQTVSAMAAGANKFGHYTIESVGNDNINYVASRQREHAEEAKKHQSAIMFLSGNNATLADEIMLACHAGLAVACGNSRAVSGSAIDKNGVKVATLGGSWAHATAFAGYRKVKGTEYVGWINSHGPRYKSSDEGEPADMCWMDKKILTDFSQSMRSYGPPYAVFPESKWNQDRSIVPMVKIPFPTNFRF